MASFAAPAPLPRRLEGVSIRGMAVSACRDRVRRGRPHSPTPSPAAAGEGEQQLGGGPSPPPDPRLAAARPLPSRFPRFPTSVRRRRERGSNRLRGGPSPPPKPQQPRRGRFPVGTHPCQAAAGEGKISGCGRAQASPGPRIAVEWLLPVGCAFLSLAAAGEQAETGPDKHEVLSRTFRVSRRGRFPTDTFPVPNPPSPIPNPQEFATMRGVGGADRGRRCASGRRW